MKRVFKALAVVALAATIATLSACASNVASIKGANFDRKPMELIGSPKYTILGIVTMEEDWYGVLGMSTPPMGGFPGADFYLWQSGGITYVDLLKKAQSQYEEADAVIDIKLDFTGSHYWFFYGNRKNIATGFAIKYSREEVSYPPATLVAGR